MTAINAKGKSKAAAADSYRFEQIRMDVEIMSA